MNTSDQTHHFNGKNIQKKRLADPNNKLYEKEDLNTIFALAQIGLIDLRSDPFLMAQLHLAQIEKNDKKIINIDNTSKKSDKRNLIYFSLVVTTFFLIFVGAVVVIFFINKNL